MSHNYEQNLILVAVLRNGLPSFLSKFNNSGHSAYHGIPPDRYDSYFQKT